MRLIKYQYVDKEGRKRGYFMLLFKRKKDWESGHTGIVGNKMGDVKCYG